MIAFLFPGQGSQYSGMGRFLLERYAIARDTFAEASEALGLDLARLCLEGERAELTETANAQPAILTASVAAFRVLAEQHGLRPDIAAGHSLGEFSALACAGAIGFADAVRLVRFRGQCMQEAVGLGRGAMAAVTGLDAALIQAECAKLPAERAVVISNYNAPGQTVISGYAAGVAAVSEALLAIGGSVTKLNVSAPFHSPLMADAALQLRGLLDATRFAEPAFPVIANITARPYTSKAELADSLTRQMTLPVRWTESMQYLVRQGVRLAVESGPGKVLKNLMRHNQTNIPAYAWDVEADARELLARLTAGGQGETAAGLAVGGAEQAGSVAGRTARASGAEQAGVAGGGAELASGAIVGAGVMIHAAADGTLLETARDGAMRGSLQPAGGAKGALAAQAAGGSASPDEAETAADRAAGVCGRVIARALAIAVCVKNNNWDNEAYQRGVIAPYKQIQRLQFEREQTAEPATREMAWAALTMLKSVLDTKLTSHDEQVRRFRQIVEETGCEDLFGEAVRRELFGGRI